MIAKDLISHSLIPLRTSDSGNSARLTMEDLKVEHLPIVNDQDLLGIISLSDIIKSDMDESIGSYDIMLDKAVANEDDHIFEVLEALDRYDLTLIPVVNKKNAFIGSILLSDLLAELSKLLSLQEQGTIIVVQSTLQEYSLAQVAQIIELENTKIFHMSVFTKPESSEVQIHIKLSKNNINEVVRSLRRYGYDTPFIYEEEDFSGFLQDRYDSLMNYLNV